MSEKKYFFLPVNTGYVNNHLPNSRYINFYSERSAHGIHCVIVGNVVIPNGFGSNSVCAEISDSKVWRDLTKAISSQGALPGIQLSSTWENYQGNKRFITKNDKNSVSYYMEILSNISTSEVLKIFENLYCGVELAIRVGFKHIQVHAAHGYLFSLLIDEAFSNYSKIALEELNSLARLLATKNIESSIRISLMIGDQCIDKNRNKLVKKIFSLPFSYFDISLGFYNIDKHLIYPNSEKLLTSRFDYTLALSKRYPNKQIIISGKSYAAFQCSLPHNVHIGICRDLIANPDFLSDPSKGCNNCMKCHYYSRGESQLTCGMWKMI